MLKVLVIEYLSGRTFYNAQYITVWGDRIKTLIALSEPYQRCSRSSARIKHIDSGLVVYQRLFPFSRAE